MNGSGELSLRYAATPGLFGIALRNFLLSAATLGLYRFWARTNLRRYFWRQVTIGDEPLEYTGTGKELFLGFLIVIAILAPFGLIYAVAQQISLSSPAAAAALQSSAFVAIGILSVIASFRARRYRLSRTAWRGIHAGQDGSAFGYLMLFIAWNILTVVTLGLASPWRRTALQRYLTNATRFGNVHLSFTGSGRSLFGRWLLVWFVVIVAVAAFAALSGGLVFLLAGKNIRLSAESLARAAALADFIRSPISLTGLIAFVLLGPIAWVWYRVREFRFFANVSALRDVHFSSAAKARRIGPIYVAYYLLIVVIPVIVAAGIGAALYFEPHAREVLRTMASGLSPQALGQIGGVAFVVLVTAIGGLVNVLWLQPRLLNHLCATLVIANPQSLETIAQSPAARQRFGEGLADSFDAGAI